METPKTIGLVKDVKVDNKMERQTDMDSLHSVPSDGVSVFGVFILPVCSLVDGRMALGLLDFLDEIGRFRWM